MVLASAFLAACSKPEAVPDKVSAAVQIAPKAALKAAVAKVVFVDQVEACECTTKRIEASWNALVAVMGDPPSLSVERIHLDTEAAKAEKYEQMESLIVPPGIYFLDENEALVKLLQGEVKAEQIAAVLQDK